ncbi:MAG: hypothetical protein AABN95_16010 [Acidobacteriota bacterium]
MLALLLLAPASLPETCVYGQRPSASPTPRPASEAEAEVKQLKSLLGTTLDRLTDATKQLETVPPLVEAIKQERIAAENERKAAAAERESAQRERVAASKAIAAEAHVNEVYEKKLVPAYDKLVEKQTARIDKLEEKLDKANKRTLWGIFGAFISGIILKF